MWDSIVDYSQFSSTLNLNGNYYNNTLILVILQLGFIYADLFLSPNIRRACQEFDSGRYDYVVLRPIRVGTMVTMKFTMAYSRLKVKCEYL